MHDNCVGQAVQLPPNGQRRRKKDLDVGQRGRGDLTAAAAAGTKNAKLFFAVNDCSKSGVKRKQKEQLLILLFVNLLLHLCCL